MQVLPKARQRPLPLEKSVCMLHHLIDNLTEYLFQSQVDFIQDWRPRQTTYLFELLSQEGPPSTLSCQTCGQSIGEFFRCLDCSHRRMYCKRCCVKAHRFLPFHHIQRWTGKFFTAASLYELGFILHIGHGGDPCPAASAWEEEDMVLGDMRDGQPLVDGDDDSEDTVMVIVDNGGVYQHKVRWCACKNRAQPDILLFRMGLFSASIINPKTAFSFRLLDYFHVDAMECRTSASSFFSKLRRLTNESFPDKVPVGALLSPVHILKQ
jgi:hypothetical protein